eukprot:CAMPEP_0174361244 /NCGR_PEP_ID=MMETSP0811_2-20130205/58279_1 /TAXON_ID=73025 ORGANISM="Eutreptiella gymnastica-like, Strain CCMP1594" /NCGR_SAMPLE_ID=MMETSP0811_2 /ASSEMBLY_ACC=CAM_ASM_000667 /LENGTH=66 /DNA_ID=CAMNT_0015497725 /DNA_START=20 /DNA_END=217 /DNA_ORIENTATION=+
MSLYDDLPPATAKSDLPVGWKKQQSSSRPGKFYYINIYTQESQWDKPTEPAPKKRAKEDEAEPSFS